MAQTIDQLLQFYRQYPSTNLSSNDIEEAHRLEKLLAQNLNSPDYQTSENLYIFTLKFNLYLIYSGLPRLKYST